MTREYTYQDLFEGEKFGLDTALKEGFSYEALHRLKVLLLLSHNQINKLEARIAELERIHSSSNSITGAVDQHEDLFKRALAADRDLRRANAVATMNKILGRDETKPIATERGYPWLQAAYSHLSHNSSNADGYVPDDFR